MDSLRSQFLTLEDLKERAEEVEWIIRSRLRAQPIDIKTARRVGGVWDCGDLDEFVSYVVYRMYRNLKTRSIRVALSTYVCNHVKWALMAIRNHSPQVGFTILQYHRHDREPLHGAQVPVEYSKDTAEEIKEDLLKLMKCLNSREREVIRGIYFEGKNAVIISKKWGVSREYVRQVKKHALEKMRYHHGIRVTQEEFGPKKSKKVSG